MSEKISKYHPHKSQPYFLYDPEDSEFIYFKNEIDRDNVVNDVIGNYLHNDGWEQEVTDIIVGKLTGQASMVEVNTPNGELDENGCDETGLYWENKGDYTCNYEMKPLGFICPSTKQLTDKE